LKDITRRRIIITTHGKLRIRGRQHFTDEEIKDIILGKYPISIKQNEYHEFELTYNYNKDRNRMVIIMVPHNLIEKSIRLVTTYHD